MSTKLLMLLILAAVEKSESAAKPVLMFRLNYSPIFRGEKIRMLCDSQPKEKDFIWFRNNVRIYEGEVYEIPSAKSEDSGSYQCQTKDGRKSEMVLLNVTVGPLLLQAPPYIHENDRLFLRCHHDPKLKAAQSIFQKDKNVVRDWDSDNRFIKPSINTDASGLYSCRKRISQDSRTVEYTASAYVSVRELFTIPEIQLTRNPADKSLTLTCKTNLSLYSPGTELWYGFYNSTANIREFKPENQFKVPAAKQKSEKYSCAVRPRTSSLTKTSRPITNTIAGLALSQNVLIISFLFIFIT